ncbi:MAG TPA: plastocyanin/azurin family copper-binding protein, partial [Euzebya sp.]|nr:plastocyanin/azurin family copper-binding protein [Euzebya sp.]
GIREIHHDEEGAEGGAEEVEIPADALVWETDDGLAFLSAPGEATAGQATIAITNSSGLAHNVTFEGFQGDAPLVEASSGQDATTVEVPAGTYVYYCSIAGHRAGGMEGEITFS